MRITIPALGSIGVIKDIEPHEAPVSALSDVDNIRFEHGCAYRITGDKQVYTDAANTVLANASATVGQLSAYDIHDASVSYKFNKNYQVKIGANNLFNEIYATRRSGGYPGPGLLPSQGRSIYGTMIIKL